MLTTKQEKFALNIFKGMVQAVAYKEAGYTVKSLLIANVNACRLLKTANVKQYLDNLRKENKSNAIMTAEERKQRLSEIARARLTDYQESGLDSGYINIGKESLNTAAIAGVKSSTKFDDNGNTSTLFTEIKLHNPIAAIAELNKMEGDYAPIKQDITSLGNELKPVRIYNIIVPETKVLLERLEHEGRVESDPDISSEPKQLSESTIQKVSE